MVFWLVTDVWVRVGWFGYTFCVGLPRGSRVVPVSAASLRASFGWLFPFLLGGTFIEASRMGAMSVPRMDFPSFWEGLSLRPLRPLRWNGPGGISLPFGRDFH